MNRILVTISEFATVIADRVNEHVNKNKIPDPDTLTNKNQIKAARLMREIDGKTSKEQFEIISDMFGKAFAEGIKQGGHKYKKKGSIGFCGVCMEKGTNHVALPSCGHHFCGGCIYKTVDDSIGSVNLLKQTNGCSFNGKVVKCPLCRTDNSEYFRLYST